ncbi:hypothetical protein [Parvibaculum lavamentivorans]|uniref:hypothetical protein n=1 Tax=Parvibaculum lavamentivorans TaxID=256618 RepID=UPI0002E73FE9|nr:hypothetical protein [Parvibaculum lavamentivorans]
MIRYQSNPVQPMPEPAAKPAPAPAPAEKAPVLAEDMDKRDCEKLGPVILDA